MRGQKLIECNCFVPTYGGIEFGSLGNSFHSESGKINVVDTQYKFSLMADIINIFCFFNRSSSNSQFPASKAFFYMLRNGKAQY